MDPEKKSLNFIFPTKYVIPKSLSRLAIGQVSFPTTFSKGRCWLVLGSVDTKCLTNGCFLEAPDLQVGEILYPY